MGKTAPPAGAQSCTAPVRKQASAADQTGKKGKQSNTKGKNAKSSSLSDAKGKGAAVKGKGKDGKGKDGKGKDGKGKDGKGKDGKGKDGKGKDGKGKDGKGNDGKGKDGKGKGKEAKGKMSKKDVVEPDESPDQAADRGVFTADQFTTFKEKFAAAAKEKKSDLVSKLLEKNIKGVQQMSKGELAEIVAVNQTLGVLSACPKCGKGQLDFNWRTGEVTCRGFKKMNSSGRWQHQQCVLGPSEAQAGASGSLLQRTAWEEVFADPPQPKSKSFFYYFAGHGPQPGGVYGHEFE